MDSSPMKTVALGTLTVSAASAFGTGVYTIFRKHPHTGFLVGIAAVNGGITAATFFSCREYFISPLLLVVAPWQQYARRRQELGIDTSSPPIVEALSDLRTNKLLDSALSGAIAGGLLRGLQTGKRAILPGAATTGVVCTLLQCGFNELTIMRLRYISKLKEENRTAVTMPDSTPRGTNSQSSTESSTPMLRAFLRFIGVKAMTDEEYLAKMKRTRDAYLKRIAELELKAEEKKTSELQDKS